MSYMDMRDTEKGRTESKGKEKRKGGEEVNDLTD